MRKILFVIGFIFSVLTSVGQVLPGYTLVNGKWEYVYFSVQKGMGIPNDTVSDAPIYSLAVKGSTLYTKLSTGSWVAVGGPGGGGVWGFIDGDINAQSDLQALAGKKYDTTKRFVDTLYVTNDTTIVTLSKGSLHSYKIRGAVPSFNNRTGNIILTLSDVTSALGYTPSNLPSVANLLQVVNAGGAVSFQTGFYSARPSAGTYGRFYLSVDSARLEFDNGTSWQSTGSGSGGVGSGTVTAVVKGYGLLPGTITTSGTVVVDSATLAMYFIRRADSGFNYITPLQLSLKEPLITAPNTVNRYWNGYKQFVGLNTDSIFEGGTNKFFTNARARLAITLTTTGSGAATYDNSTGIFNIPTNSGGSDSGFSVQRSALPGVPIQKSVVGSARFIIYDTSANNTGGIVTQASRQKLSDSLQAIFNSLFKLSTDSVRLQGYTTIANKNKLADSLTANFNALIALYKQKADSIVPSGYTTIANKNKLADSLTANFNALLGLYKQKTDSIVPSGYTTVAHTNKVADSLRAIFNTLLGTKLDTSVHFNLYVRKDGGRGINPIRLHDSAIIAKGIVDSIDAHALVNGDSTVTISVQAHDTVSANALATKYDEDTSRTRQDLQIAGKVVNAGASKSITAGTLGSRPAASNCQCYYFSTTDSTWSYDNGSWIPVKGGAAGGSSTPPGNNGDAIINKNGAYGTIWGFRGDTVSRMVHTHQLRANKQVMIGPDSVQPGVIGTIFDDNFKRSSLGSAYTFNQTGATMTFPSSDHMHVVATSGTFANYIEYTSASGFNLDTLYSTVVCQDTLSTSYGIALGQESHNPFFSAGNVVQFSFSPTTNKGKINYWSTSGGAQTSRFISANAIAVQPLDTLDIKTAKLDSVIVNTVYNRRTGVTQSYSAFFKADNSFTSTLPNTGNWRLYFLGGTVDVLRFGAYSPEHTGGVAFLHNSIGTGFLETYWNGGFEFLLRPNARQSYFRFGGIGDRPEEALIDSNLFWLGKPRLVYYQLAENALNSSEALGTFSTNVQTTLNSIAYHGAKAVIIGGCPQTGKLIKPYNDTLQAICSRRGLEYINVYDTLRNGTDYNTAFSTDGVHPNTLGQIAMATQMMLQDTNFAYSKLVMPNPSPALPNDTSLRYALFDKNNNIVYGSRKKDSATYVHQTPAVADTGSINIAGTIQAGILHVGAKPVSSLPNSVSWLTANGGSLYIPFSIQGTDPGDFPGFQMVNQNNVVRASIYIGNSSASFLPNTLVFETLSTGASMRFFAGNTPNRGLDYDFGTDSLNFLLNHNAHYTKRPKYGSWTGPDSLALPTLTQVDSAMRKIAHDSASGSGGANYQTVQLNASSLTQRAKLNVLSPLTAVDNSGNTSTDIGLGSLSIIKTTGSGISNAVAGNGVPTTSTGGFSGTAVSGNISVNTGTTGGTAGGTIYTVTLATAQPTSGYTVILQDNYSGTHVNVYVSNLSTTQFIIGLQSGQSLATSTTYQWSYIIVN